VGDPSRARKRLGWEPTLDFEQLVRRMVEAELAALGEGDPAVPAEGGDRAAR
jgi:GDPmannose 4,6-dehydratase